MYSNAFSPSLHLYSVILFSKRYFHLQHFQFDEGVTMAVTAVVKEDVVVDDSEGVGVESWGGDE